MTRSTTRKAWAATLAAVLALPARGAELPDFGTPADTALSKSREAQIGRGVMLQLRNAGVVMDDPLLTEYVSTLGSQLASRANDGTFQFEFFVAKDDQINAFALPGGFVGINSGLIVASDTESELAGVLAHEISHVTQRHLARAAYDNQRTSIMSIAALLAAVVLGASSNSSSANQAMQGMMIGSQALAAQRQINFTRANESEADRVGMDLLAQTGFDPYGMASFFDKLGNRFGGSNQFVPAILQSHPVTAERTAEARSRARQLPPTTHTDSVNYALTKARIQVLNASSPEAAYDLFRNKKDSTSPGDRYGLALASMRVNLNDNAERLMKDLGSEFPSVIAFRIGQAEAMLASGETDAAMRTYQEAIRLSPRNIPLTISYAEALIADGKPAKAHELLLDLLNNVPATPAQLRLIARAANAEGDVANAYFYMSYYYASIGNLPLAIGQVRLALETPDVHTVDRARFKARLDQLLEYLPDEQREYATRSGSH
ncbi:MAG TPA: M48 family metalloprotease [Gammaproteobacteria bacterium]|jgi:predicted Zn-dependent protease|nr:M48 family metalloprotease [Gammaproteobacteria bacterium]